MKRLAILLAPFACASALAQEPRVSLTFISDQTDELLPVVQEAQRIWASEGNRILQVMEDVSGLKFEERAIVVIVHRAASVSGAPIPTSPLKLNARYRMSGTSLMLPARLRLRRQAPQRSQSIRDEGWGDPIGGDDAGVATAA